MTTELELIEGGDTIRHQAAVWFARLRADDASEDDRRAWQAWLARDPRHKASYSRLERLWSSLGEHAPLPEIASRMQAIAPVSRPVRPRGRWGAGLSAMAAVLALAAAGVWQWLVGGAPPATRDYVTGVGEHRRVLLEDGSHVTLDTDTRVRVTYSARARLLALEQGRAYFEVARETRPFSVDTGHGVVRALGTAFEVYRREESADVALLEGEVLLIAGDGRARMNAGHAARLGDGGVAPSITVLQEGASPAWLSGRLVFNDVSLQEVAREFNRYSHRRIVLADPALSGIRVTGVFRNDRVQAFIGALCDAYPIAADLSDPAVARLVHAGRRTGG